MIYRNNACIRSTIIRSTRCDKIPPYYYYTLLLSYALYTIHNLYSYTIRYTLLMYTSHYTLYVIYYILYITHCIHTAHLCILNIHALTAYCALLMYTTYYSICYITHYTSYTPYIYVSYIGTGKTLLARQLSYMLSPYREPKIINGPEILGLYIFIYCVNHIVAFMLYCFMHMLFL